MSVGVVPSVNPALYAVGLSYKAISALELFAGAGIRKDRPTSFVYGLTLDLDEIFDVIFGKARPAETSKGEADVAAGPEGEKAAAQEPSRKPGSKK